MGSLTTPALAGYGYFRVELPQVERTIGNTALPPRGHDWRCTA
jgi:hypothetical protein